MKKALSIIISLVIMMTATAAFAAEKSDVENDIKSTISNLYGSKTEFTVKESVDFLRLIRSGADTFEFESNYVNSVKEMLVDNGGKLLYDGEETAYMYASVIECLLNLGYDTSSFEGVNLNELFVSLDFTTASNASSANIYRVILEAAEDIDAKDEYIDSILDFLFGKYTMGKGYDFYGFSCDNTGHFLAAIGSVYDTFTDKTQPYIDDAVKVIKGYLIDDGYYSDDTYGTLANADSTAEALLAFSIIGLDEKDEAYTLLKNFALENGGYSFLKGDDESAYASAEALDALIYYNYTLNEKETEENEKETEEDVDTTSDTSANTGNTISSGNEETTTPKTTDKSTDNSTKSPNTGGSSFSFVPIALSLGLGVIIITKSKKHMD